jgi:hypothetical protein
MLNHVAYRVDIALLFGIVLWMYIATSLVSCVVFCRAFVVLFLLPFCFFSFDLRLLITPLVGIFKPFSRILVWFNYFNHFIDCCPTRIIVAVFTTDTHLEIHKSDTTLISGRTLTMPQLRG